jgi:DNA helicase-2/ATP-dependent DNA helicase PcrA
MTAVGEAKIYTEPPEWRHGNSAFDVITDYFLPAIDTLDIPLGEAAILASTWGPLFQLSRRLREYGVSIVGPGARPYRRNRHFAPLAEQVCGYMMEPRPQAIAGIERTLFNTVLDLTGRAHFEVFSYEGRRTVFRLIHEAQVLHAKHPSAVNWLHAAANSFTGILIEEKHFANAERDLFATSVEQMKADMRSNRVDLANLTIDDLGIYANPEGALKLSTLHNAKGREYQAVAMVDLHEGRIPFYQATTTEEFDEAKRLFYVGLTRAKRLLLYITDQSHERNQPSRFLRNGGVGVC